MKKIIITLLLAVMPAVTFAQNAFTKYEGKEGIDVVTVNKKMFELLGGIETSGGGEKADKYLKQVKNLDNLKIFTTTQLNYIADMETTVASYLKQNSLEELMTFNDGGAKTKLYVRSGKKASELKEFLLFSQGGKKNEAVLMSFSGNIDLNGLK
ncbi:DUF4252 domain-containing protein [Flavobacterium rivuli]|uniref:DUF4252 domain-containing protein n=1 Tax=Flavobacterium rivuli TaxID=498301 RepID=UPI000375A65C|nr:DUF4252 domain-containing protein [Flavobacterium rivuli]